MRRKAPNGSGQSRATAEPSAPRQALDTAKLETFRSALKRARSNKSISKYADQAFATKDPVVKAAYDELKMRLANAWKSEFQQALAQADFYLGSKKPITREDRQALENLIKKMKKLLKGRPHGGERRPPAAAERAAVYLARERLKFLRETSGRKRISKESGSKLIAETIEAVSFQLGVPSKKISPENVARLLYKK